MPLRNDGERRKLRRMGDTAQQLLDLLAEPSRAADLVDGLQVSRQRVDQLLRALAAKGLVTRLVYDGADVNQMTHRWVRSERADIFTSLPPGTLHGKVLVRLRSGVAHDLPSLCAALDISGSQAFKSLLVLRKKCLVDLVHCNPPARAVFRLTRSGEEAAARMAGEGVTFLPAASPKVMRDPALCLLKAFVALERATGTEAIRLARVLHPEISLSDGKADPYVTARRDLERARLIDRAKITGVRGGRDAVWQLSPRGKAAARVILAISPMPDQGDLLEVFARTLALQHSTLAQLRLLAILQGNQGGLHEDTLLRHHGSASRFWAAADLKALHIRNLIAPDTIAGHWVAAPVRLRGLDWEHAPMEERRLRVIQDLSLAPASVSDLAQGMAVDINSVQQAISDLKARGMVEEAGRLGGEKLWRVVLPHIEQSLAA